MNSQSTQCSKKGSKPYIPLTETAVKMIKGQICSPTDEDFEAYHQYWERQKEFEQWERKMEAYMIHRGYPKNWLV